MPYKVGEVYEADSFDPSPLKTNRVRLTLDSCIEVQDREGNGAFENSRKKGNFFRIYRTTCWRLAKSLGKILVRESGVHSPFLS